jgi:hypothetical protein
MKKILLFTAASVMYLFSSCNSCGPEEQGIIVETETDSIISIGNPQPPQTFIFQGTSPMNGNNVADVMLAISTVSLNDDGTFSITTDYVDEGLATQNDNGEAIIVTGMDNDSTVTVIELVSANSNPAMNFMMQSDTSLVKVDKNGKPVSNDPSHKLTLKKKK